MAIVVHVRADQPLLRPRGRGSSSTRFRRQAAAAAFELQSCLAIPDVRLVPVCCFTRVKLVGSHVGQPARQIEIQKPSAPSVPGKQMEIDCKHAPTGALSSACQSTCGQSESSHPSAVTCCDAAQCTHRPPCSQAQAEQCCILLGNGQVQRGSLLGGSHEARARGVSKSKSVSPAACPGSKTSTCPQMPQIKCCWSPTKVETGGFGRRWSSSGRAARRGATALGHHQPARGDSPACAGAGNAGHLALPAQAVLPANR
jgi:hypothetical protein